MIIFEIVEQLGNYVLGGFHHLNHLVEAVEELALG